MAKIETLFDAFNGVSLNTTLWRIQTPPTPDPASTITVGAGVLTIVQASKGITLYSQNSYDWTNSSFVIGPIDGLCHIIASGPIQLTNDGAQVQFGEYGNPYGFVTYNATTMRYFRFRCTTTAVYAGYSTDGNTWVEFSSVATTIPTAAAIGIEIGVNSNTTTIRGVNIIPNTGAFLPFFI